MEDNEEEEFLEYEEHISVDSESDSEFEEEEKIDIDKIDVSQFTHVQDIKSSFELFLERG